MIAYSTGMYHTAKSEEKKTPLNFLHIFKTLNLNLLNARILALNPRLHQHGMTQDQNRR